MISPLRVCVYVCVIYYVALLSAPHISIGSCRSTLTTVEPPCRQEVEGEGEVQCANQQRQLAASKPHSFQARGNGRRRITDEGDANSLEHLPSVAVLLCVRY